MRLLNGRSDGSVEFKHQNISAVLIELGYPYIEGYKPRWNLQALLAEAVDVRLSADRELERAVRSAVDAPAAPTELDDLIDRIDEAPARIEKARHNVKSEPGTFLVSPTMNYLEREGRNRSLGRMGEKFALAFETARLETAGATRLSRQVEHVSTTRGDGLGYDIRSFEVGGSDRLIEVKTTGFGKQTPFFVSRNELMVSRLRPEYFLYRAFSYRTSPRLYVLQGPIDRNFSLEPVHYRAGIA